jgi:pimeloyl-ACP methyl ester carboxylesterase
MDRPDAIIFLSGLGERRLRQGALDIAARLARALDFRAATESVVFTARAVAPLPYGTAPGREAPAARIVRRADDTQTVVADLFRVPYHGVLFRRDDDKRARPLADLGFLLAHTLLFSVRWVMGLRRCWAFGLRKGLQLLWGAAMLAALVGAIVLTIAAALSVPILEGTALVTDGQGEVFESMQPVLQTARAKIYPVVALLAGLLATSRTNLKQDLHTMALHLAAMHDYLDDTGYKRDEVVAEVEGVLEAVVESDVEYGRVLLVGYSLGAVIALDTVHLNPRPPRRIGRIDMVVTVGGPFDVITTYWPSYFVGRTDKPPQIPWHNVYSPKDVLGSDCRLLNRQIADKAPSPDSNATYPAAPARGLDVLSLSGILAHSRYWTNDNPDHPAVWRPVSVALYPEGHPAVG